jgi:hypothetical protein
VGRISTGATKVVGANINVGGLSHFHKFFVQLVNLTSGHSLGVTATLGLLSKATSTVVKITNPRGPFAHVAVSSGNFNFGNLLVYTE